MNAPNPPTLKRRLICMVYEALLLFAVGFLAIAVALFAKFFFSQLIPANFGPYFASVLQAWLFVAMGIYFVWLWSHGGQTLPMKTWRIKLVMSDNSPVTVKHAIGRYLCSWLCFLPGLALAWVSGARAWMLALIPLLNLLLWAVAAFLDPTKQFVHDRLAGTKIISDPKPVRL